MDNIKEGGFVNRPSILDRINYEYLKVYMFDFFKSIDNKIWEVVINWGTPLTIKVDDGFEYVKPKNDWELMLLSETLVPLMLFTMELTKIFPGSLTYALMTKRHEQILKWLMKELPKFKCQGFKSPPPKLKTWRWWTRKLLLSSMFISMTLPKSPMFVSVTLSIEIWRDPRFYKNT